MFRVSRSRLRAFGALLLAPLLLPAGLALLILGFAYPLLARKTTAEFIDWKVQDEDCEEQYYAAHYRFFDGAGKAIEFTSGTGCYSKEPPVAPPESTTIRYLPFLPHYADTLDCNPLFGIGALLVVMSAPVWTILIIAFSAYFLFVR